MAARELQESHGITYQVYLCLSCDLYHAGRKSVVKERKERTIIDRYPDLVNELGDRVVKHIILENYDKTRSMVARDADLRTSTLIKRARRAVRIARKEAVRRAMAEHSVV